MRRKEGAGSSLFITLVIMVIGTIAVFFLKEIPLRGGRQKAAETPAEETPEAGGQHFGHGRCRPLKGLRVEVPVVDKGH